jgi:hypothetical protein
MEQALAVMRPRLPDDVAGVGDEAHRTVQFWLGRLAQGGADLVALAAAMQRIAEQMDALSARLLLRPFGEQPVERV